MNKYENVKISIAALFFTHVGSPVYRTAVLLVKSIDVGPSGEQESHHLKVAKKTKTKKHQGTLQHQPTHLPFAINVATYIHCMQCVHIRYIRVQ